MDPFLNIEKAAYRSPLAYSFHDNSPIIKLNKRLLIFPAEIGVLCSNTYNYSAASLRNITLRINERRVIR